jgi:hypothetical protein
MESEESAEAYVLSRAVEEPLEATFELGENIKDTSSKMGRPVILGILGNIIFLTILLPSIYYIFSPLVDALRGNSELTTAILLQSLLMGIVIIFLLSITVTSTIYLVQIYKFNSFLFQRYSLVTGLAASEIQEKDTKYKKYEGGVGKVEGKHVKNPIFAMLDLVEESMHELPQIVKLLRYSTYFINVSVLFVAIILLIRLAFSFDIFFVRTVYEIILGIICVVVFLPSLILLLESERSFVYLKTRHNIIDSVRFQEDISIPKGEDQLARLFKYLNENDPYVNSSYLEQNERFKEEVKIKGSSGDEHEFNAFFKGVNILKEKSVALDMPMGRFAVFIRVYKDDITMDSLSEFREAVLDVCKKDETFPLRVIALQWEVKDLPDDVYEYVLENPILWKNTLTHIQIVAEDGEIYSFIPMMAYGEDTG